MKFSINDYNGSCAFDQIVITICPFFSELKALINNAGVMIFGEFEWLTEQHIQSQINVNLLGTMRVTKSFCPLLRKYKGIKGKKSCAFYWSNIYFLHCKP